MNKRLKLYLSMFLFAMTSSLWVSCSDEEEITDDNYPTLLPTPDPVDDVVEKTFNGKVAILDDGSILNYLLIRLPNVTHTVDEETSVVLLGEKKIGEILGDEALFEKILSHWQKNRAVGFFNPSIQTLKFYLRLSGYDMEEVNELISDEQKARYENLAFFIAKADGSSMKYMRPDKNVVSWDMTDELTGETTKIPEETVTTDPTAYRWGRIAERAVEWMDENKATDGDSRAITLFVNSRNSGYQNKTVSKKVYNTFTVDHSALINRHDFGDSPENKTGEAVVEMTGTSGYNEEGNYDVYDVKVRQIFDGSQTYATNFITKYELAYKYKYSGGNYYGPTVELELYNGNDSQTSVHEPAPIGSPGTYNTLHNPAGAGMGMGLSGGVAGLGGEFGGNFSFSFTMPSVSVNKVHEEMPVNYTDGTYKSTWDYGEKFLIYKGRLGFNAVYEGPLDISIKDCSTEQALTFKISDSRSMGNRVPYLSAYINYKTFHEICSPWDHWSCVQHNKCWNEFELPMVYRYFDRYTPYCYQSSDDADTASWTNLENRLKGNVNYKNFCNADLKVGGITQAKLEESAGRLWREAVESLVNQYNGTFTTQEYVVAIAATNGTPLKLGLHIKDGVWKLVEDITTVKVEKK